MDKRVNYVLPFLFALLLLLTGLVLADVNLSAIPWSAFGSGGGVITNGDIRVNTALGQPMVGHSVEDGVGVRSGFLQVVPVAPIAVEGVGGTNANGLMQLTWTAVSQDIYGHNIGGVTYTIYRSQESPYFEPDVAYATDVSDTMYIDPDTEVFGNSEINTFYLVTAVYQEQESAVSNHVGVFVFPLTSPDVHNLGLENGSFEEGWNTIQFGNQQPINWTLSWVQPGDPLFDSPELATGICECVHKHTDQLPPDQQPGGPDPLILDGDYVFKIFSGEAFGTELSQTISGLEPGADLILTLPIRLHRYGDPDPWAAESSLWVNNEGGWANAEAMGDGQWCKHEQVFTVPEDGIANITVRVKSITALVKDFFIDDIRLTRLNESVPHAEMDTCTPD